MESLNNNNQSSIDGTEEEKNISKDDQSISRSPTRRKSKHKKRTSTSSLRDDEKSKTKTRKSRHSLASSNQSNPGKTDILTISKPKNYDRISSSFNDVKIESRQSNHELGIYFPSSTLGKRYSDQSLQEDEAENLHKYKDTDNFLSLTVEEQLNLWKEEEIQKQMAIDEKFPESNELDMTGIMNLSSMNFIDSDVPTIIQKAFGDPKTKCIGLILRDNNLTYVGLQMLVDGILGIKLKLKYLSLSNNTTIGDQGIEHLIRLFKKHRSITFLALPNTGITDHGVRLLADVIIGIHPDASCPHLEKLHISFNKSITDKSTEALLQIIEQNQTLKVLSIQQCDLSEDARQILREAVAKKKKKRISLAD